MYILLSRCWVAFGLLFVSSIAWPASAPSELYKLAKDGTGAVTHTPNKAIVLTADSDQPIEIQCDKGVDCTKYSLSYAQKGATSGGKALQPDPAFASIPTDAKWILPSQLVTKCEAGEILFSLKPGRTGETPSPIDVSAPSDSSCTSQPPAAANSVGGGNGTDQSSVQTLLTTDCSDEIRRLSSMTTTDIYDPKNNLARFIVTASGNVLARPSEAVDENDTVDVIVVADKDLLPRLKVKRTSAIRTLGDLNIVGQGTTIPGVLKALKCGSQQFVLGDFAPGKGEVTISVAANQGDTTTGTFEFNVSTLYSGAFSIGPMYTTLKAPTFGLVNKGSGNVVTETDRGSDRIIYTLMFTPFIWGKRDLEKDQLMSGFDWHRLNPMFGIVLNDVSNNAILGVSYDLSSLVYVNLGAHFAKINRLDPSSGLTVGGAFSGSGTTVPTQTQWKTGFFVGFSMDLRAATKFFGFATSK